MAPPLGHPVKESHNSRPPAGWNRAKLFREVCTYYYIIIGTNIIELDGRRRPKEMRMFRFVCLKHKLAISLWVLYQTCSRYWESIGVHDIVFYKQKRQGYTEGDRCRSSPPPGQIKVCSGSHAFPRAIARPQMLPQDRELCYK